MRCLAGEEVMVVLPKDLGPRVCQLRPGRMWAGELVAILRTGLGG